MGKHLCEVEGERVGEHICEGGESESTSWRGGRGMGGKWESTFGRVKGEGGEWESTFVRGRGANRRAHLGDGEGDGSKWESIFVRGRAGRAGEHI